jgi:thioesterase domain-containing protein
LPFLSAGGDSLSALRLLAEIQREFGRELGVAAVLDGGSINRLAELLGQPGAESRALVPIQPNGCRPPLYLVHPLGGQVMGFRPLARHLGPAQPVYGLQALGAGSIEEMASRYIAEVVAHQPIGPLHLGGYSMGAYIAFEMARLARERGREVGLLAAIDDGPALLRPRPRTSLLELAGFLANAPRWLHHQATQRRWSEPFRDAGRKLRSWIRQLAGSGASLDEVLDASLYTDRQRDLMAAHYTALRNYRPRPYQGAMILFRARVQPLLGAHEADLGWKALVQRGIGIEVVPGNHDLILSEPWVVHLAAGLSRHLQAPSRRAAA